jgi:hypothetical protein
MMPFQPVMRIAATKPLNYFRLMADSFDSDLTPRRKEAKAQG